MSLSRRSLLLGGTLAGGGLLGAGYAYRRLSSTSSRPLSASPVDAVPPAAAGEAALDFLVTGDTGQETELRRELAGAMLLSAERIGARFVVLAGDNVYPAGVVSTEDPAWVTHFEAPYGELAARIPFYPCLGNHDYGGNAMAQVEYSAKQPAWRLPAPYHAFSYDAAGEATDGAHGAAPHADFLVLDTPAMRLGTWAEMRRQIAWAEERLAGSRARWRIVIGHHPMYSGGPKGGSSKMRWGLGAAFARFDVDLYLSGHNHDLELLDSRRGWLQVVSGAGSKTQEVVRTTEHTLFSTEQGGFAWVSLRADAAWIQFESASGPLACYRVDRPTAVT